MPEEHLPPNVLNVFESKRKIRAKSGQGTKKHDVKQLQHTADPSTSERDSCDGRSQNQYGCTSTSFRGDGGTALIELLTGGYVLFLTTLRTNSLGFENEVKPVLIGTQGYMGAYWSIGCCC